MRLIDADALEKRLLEKGFYPAIVKRAIEDAPVVDAVEVVRCKDCIYTRKLYGRLVCKYGTCSGCILCEDFFCATGERRGEEDGESKLD
nr:MAG TPA: hypothetical protein [Caudoviricetes sp.]